jgi:hypothetical protein
MIINYFCGIFDLGSVAPSLSRSFHLDPFHLQLGIEKGTGVDSRFGIEKGTGVDSRFAPRCFFFPMHQQEYLRTLTILDLIRSNGYGLCGLIGVFMGYGVQLPKSFPEFVVRRNCGFVFSSTTPHFKL